VQLTLGRVAELVSATGGFDRNLRAQGYSIDSRSVQRGQLFFAVRGERLDGHDFVVTALARGAVGAVVNKRELPRYADKSALLAVPDTLAALQALATAVRKQWAKPLIAVTGSTGKTTTKEAIAHLLATGYRVLKSEGNLNNHFGLPLQLLRIEPEHQVAVVELGMNHAGEIAALARIALPDIGVVTNVAPVHLEFFATLADIARAKYELIASLPQTGTAVLNADDEFSPEFARAFSGKAVTFGIRRPADVSADPESIVQRGVSGSEFEIVAKALRQKAILPLMGVHNIYNALAAVTVALERGVPLSQCVTALATLRPAEKRGQILEIGGATVLNDCYNSNPQALEAMVETLGGMPAARRIVVAGEMLELGSAAEELHRASGVHIAGMKIDALLGVRGMASAMVEAARAAGMRAEFAETPEAAGEWLAREVRPGDVVLLKASRGVKLERALENWQWRLSTAAGKAHS